MLSAHMFFGTLVREFFRHANWSRAPAVDEPSVCGHDKLDYYLMVLDLRSASYNESSSNYTHCVINKL